LEKISEIIENYIFKKYNSNLNYEKNNIKQNFEENNLIKGDIKNILLGNVRNGLFCNILNCFETFEVDFNHLLEDESGRTNFNFVSTTYMFTLFFIKILNYINLFNLDSFISTDENNLNINPIENKNIILSLENQQNKLELLNKFIEMQHSMLRDFEKLLTKISDSIYDGSTKFQYIITSLNNDNFLNLNERQLTNLLKEFEDFNESDFNKLLISYLKTIEEPMNDAINKLTKEISNPKILGINKVRIFFTPSDFNFKIKLNRQP
jgi:hypothetical protein